MSDLPYRRNVGAALFDGRGRVFMGRRADRPRDGETHWQMPQGGIDDGEEPRAAVLRELEEEIGTADAAVLAEHPGWLTYDLPPELLGRVLGGRYRGQTQKWFALRFLGSDAAIRLDRHEPAEFDDWRWVALAEIVGMAVPFKRGIYAELVQVFGEVSAPR